MRTYIAPIGYDSTRITRPVLSQGIDENDRLVVLQPAGQEHDERADEALNDVRRMVNELEPSIDVVVSEVPFDDFYAAMLRCLEVLQSADGNVIVVLGGGARDIFLPLSIATLTQQTLVDTVLQFSDITGDVKELDLPNVLAQLTDSQYETLNALSETPSRITMSDLETQVGHSKSTIARHISRFEEFGFVQTRYEGRSKVIEFCSAGEVFLAAQNPPE